MAKIKLLIAGGRFFNRKSLFHEALYRQLKKWGVKKIPDDIEYLVCGICPTGRSMAGTNGTRCKTIRHHQHFTYLSNIFIRNPNQ